MQAKSAFQEQWGVLTKRGGDVKPGGGANGNETERRLRTKDRRRREKRKIE
jgi:hypothetical protein